LLKSLKARFKLLKIYLTILRTVHIAKLTY
jgi:hypothetical protein